LFKTLSKLAIITTLAISAVPADAKTRFIRGHNVCAKNVNLLRAALGLPQTHSASAASFRKFKSTRKPRHGSVMLVRRSGGSGFHVAVYDGGGYCLNPSSRRQNWQRVKCSTIWAGHSRYFVS
jgi:hypothetical protein